MMHPDRIRAVIPLTEFSDGFQAQIYKLEPKRGCNQQWNIGAEHEDEIRNKANKRYKTLKEAFGDVENIVNKGDVAVVILTNTVVRAAFVDRCSTIYNTSRRDVASTPIHLNDKRGQLHVAVLTKRTNSS